MSVKIIQQQFFIFYAVILITILFQPNIFAQNEAGGKIVFNTDSSTVLQKKVYNPFLTFPLTNRFTPSINYDNEELDLRGSNPSDAWGISMARLRQSSFLANDFTDNLNVDLYMNNFLFKEKGFMTGVRYVLGLAGTSAAAYFAYKHIQKYGFINEKKK